MKDQMFVILLAALAVAALAFMALAAAEAYRYHKRQKDPAFRAVNTDGDPLDAATSKWGDTYIPDDGAGIEKYHLVTWGTDGDRTIKKAAPAAGVAVIGGAMHDQTDTNPVAVQFLNPGETLPVRIGNEAVDVGDELYLASGGLVTKTASANSVKVGACIEKFDAAGSGNTRVILMKPYATPSGPRCIAAGIHVWAGGAATTDEIALPGVLATDVVVAQLAARNSTETLVLAITDADAVNLTLSANGTDSTTKIHYAVFRA